MKKNTPTAKERIRHALSVIRPITRTAERVATLALQAKSLTSPFGVIGLMSSAANALGEQFSGEAPAPCETGFRVPVSHAFLVAAYKAAGCTVTVEIKEKSSGGAGAITEISDGDHSLKVYIDGSVSVIGGAKHDAAVSRLTEVLDAHLPPSLLVQWRPGEGGYPWVTEERRLTEYRSDQGRAIADCTIPMLDKGGRVILLNGKPGVGKSTIAEEIAQYIGGRVIVLGGGIFSPKGEYDAHTTTSGCDIEQLALLTPTVIVIDDVDKIHIPLARLEKLRAIARLVIMTANNGEYDDVLDGALDRPGRTDETFEVMPDRGLTPQPPFDKLDREIWTKIKGWPIAHLNELRRRIEERGTSPAALNLTELERRLKKGTRSGSVLHSHGDDGLTR
jgi:hypothetical protein